MKLLLMSILFLATSVLRNNACTIIVAGKKATTDGSVIVSHTDAGADCRLRVIPRKKYKKGDMAPVFYGIQQSDQPLNEYGDTLGYIPQVRETYQYIHSAYSHINEFQLAIGESTLSQRKELQMNRGDGDQIITIEQAQVFALQRCKTAREALTLITSLVEEYGFLPSCGPESECLVIADTNEAWVLEVFSVGKGWKKNSGKLGAIWAAQRLPDEHVTMIPNWSIIKTINVNDTENYRASKNYMQVAIEKGWYSVESGKPFVWQEAYSPTPREWATGRFWLFHALYAPELSDLPNRWTDNPFQGEDQYTQFVESLSTYPFSFKPNKLISVQEVMKFQRSTFTGTIYDKENSAAWYYPDKEGKMKKSAFATPFPHKETRKLLRINSRRNVARARGEYGMIAQLRGWLPDEIGGIYYVYVDNAYTSPYVPIYTGVTDVAECYKRYNKNKYDEKSMRWAVDFVDNLLYLRWQDAIKDVRLKRDVVENRFFKEQTEVDKKALKLVNNNRQKAKVYLTELTIDRMNELHQLYKELRIDLITKYTNNKQGI